MNKEEILKALDEGAIPCTRLLIGTGEDDWCYVNVDVSSLKLILDEQPDDKIFPCYLSPYKSILWFEILEA